MFSPLIVARLNQTGTVCVVDTIFNDTTISYLDEVSRLSIGEYRALFSDDLLSESITQVDVVRRETVAVAVTAEYEDVNSVRIHAKDANDQPVDINGEIYLILRLEP